MQSEHALDPTSTTLTLGGQRLTPSEEMAASFLTRYRGRTLTSYTNDLRQYFRWCAAMGFEPIDAGRMHLELYIRFMESPDAVPATKTKPARAYRPISICRRFATVALMYKYAEIDELIDKDPAVYVTRPKAPTEKLGDHTNLSEIRLLLASAEKVTAWPSEYALMCLLAMNGLRISEALGIDIEDVRDWKSMLVIRIVGKGNKPADIPLSIPAMHAVRQAIGDRTAGPLLLGRWGQRMSECAARDVIDRHTRLCGIEGKRITPHSFRRGAITAALDADIPLRNVQHFARHADPRTTSRYDRSGDNPMANATHHLAAVYSQAI